MSMPRAVLVKGSFKDSSERPVHGLVRFTPSRLWVVTDGITWACLAPEVWTDPYGRFSVALTATDNDTVPWTYRIDSPAGQFVTYAPWELHGYTLPGLLHEHGVEIVS